MSSTRIFSLFNFEFLSFCTEIGAKNIRVMQELGILRSQAIEQK